jgi:outer membrane lipoprotein SlyB
MLLSFTEIETDHGWFPLVATVVSVPGEHGVHTDDREGEIERNGVDKRRAIESAAAGAAVGAAAGAVGGGGKGAGIGAGAGAELGTTAGILSDRNLRLEKGTELELRLDRPLTVPQN